jgi:hypothetical protein
MGLDKLKELVEFLRAANVSFYKDNIVELVLGPAPGLVKPMTDEKPAEVPPYLKDLPGNYRNPRLFGSG